MDHYLQVLYPINGASKQWTLRTLSLRPILHKLFAARLERQRRLERTGGLQLGAAIGAPRSPNPQVHPKGPVNLQYTELGSSAFNA